MRIQKKARKWVLNLWTIALTVLSATGLNPFEVMDHLPLEAQIVQEMEPGVEIGTEVDPRCALRTGPTDDVIEARFDPHG
jgi:hypothetical protein